MSATLFSVTSGAITWDKQETDATQDELAYVNIKCTGWTASTQGLDTALALIPDVMPIGDSGPCGNVSTYRINKLQRRSAKFEDGMIRLDCSYKCVVSNVIQNGGGDFDNSEDDKTSLRISTASAPILSHPVVKKFPNEQKSLLAGLLKGVVRVGAEVEASGEAKTEGKEFVTRKSGDGLWDVEVKFSETSYSVTMSGKTITASPLDFARMINVDITDYLVAAPIFSWSGVRRTGISASDLNKVGTVYTPPNAPSVSERDWVFTGLTQDEITDGIYLFQKEFTLSEHGGALKQLYAGGHQDINE